MAPRNSVSSKRRRGLAFEREQVDVLLNARADGRAAVGNQILAQQRESAGAIAIRRHELCFHFDGRAQGQRQMRLGVQRTRGQGLQGELFGLLGVGFGLIELARDQVATREPGERFQILGRRADAGSDSFGASLRPAGNCRATSPFRRR